MQLHRFRPRLLDALDGYDRQRFAKDLGAGITVGIVALPLALAFGIASGVKPEQGLITAIVAGFLISALGGSQVQIGGPAGAFIVIVYGIVDKHGVTGLLISTAAAGVLMFLLGLFRLGVLIRYIPISIVIGFTNGIAVLIGLSQLRDALGLPVDKMPGEFFAQIETIARHLPGLNPFALAITAGCVVLLALWPRIQAWQPRLARVPGPIVALVLATLLVAALSLPVETIASRFGELPRGLPSVELPPISWASLQQLTMPIITIALLGAIESLLCARVADGMSEHKRHDPNQELMAQGVANVVSPIFAGIPATGTIARTVTNVRAGAATPVAGIVHAGVLLVILLAAAPLAGHVPLAALAGILLITAWNMFERHEFVRLRHFAVTYRTLMLTTFVLTIVFDLTVAVEVGLVMACLFFIWRMGTLFSVQALAAGEPGGPGGSTPLPEGVAGFALYGALFFGAVGKIEALPEQLPAGTRLVALDLQRLVSMDTSGLDALMQMRRTLERQGVGLVLAHVNAQPLSLMRRAGFEAQIGAENIVASLAEVRAPAPAPASA